MVDEKEFLLEQKKVLEYDFDEFVRYVFNNDMSMHDYLLNEGDGLSVFDEEDGNRYCSFKMPVLGMDVIGNQIENQMLRVLPFIKYFFNDSGIERVVLQSQIILPNIFTNINENNYNYETNKLEEIFVDRVIAKLRTHKSNIEILSVNLSDDWEINEMGFDANCKEESVMFLIEVKVKEEDVKTKFLELFDCFGEIFNQINSIYHSN